VDTDDIEVVVGRDKVVRDPPEATQVAQNILVNVFFSVGMGFALLIMGIDIDLEQVMETVR